MTKKLNIAQITSELEGSAFFPGRRPPPEAVTPPQPTPVVPAHASGVMASRPHDPMVSQRHDATTPSPSGTPAAERQTFDLGRIPDTRFSLRVTQDEYEALDDVERDLRRTYAVAASKNDLIRCALHHLLEDYQRAKGSSLLLRRLKRDKAS